MLYSLKQFAPPAGSNKERVYESVKSIRFSSNVWINGNGEGIRYWDLLRQGISVAAATIAANTTVSIFSDGTANPPSASKLQANITATRGFQQIPNDQITLSSGVLKQNAGW